MGKSQSKNKKKGVVDEEYLERQTSALHNATGLNRVEIRKIQEVFDEVKSTKGEGLNETQFNEVLGRLEHFGTKELKDTPFSNQLFKQFDSNQDGLVDHRELSLGLALLCRGTMEEKLAITFQAYDLDGNGYISLQEMKHMFVGTYEATLRTLRSLQQDELQVIDDTEMHEFSENFANVMTSVLSMAWDQLDTNQDGKLSFEEFKQFAMSDPNVCATLNGLRSEVKMTLV